MKKTISIILLALLVFIAPIKTAFAEDVNNPDGWNDSTKVTYGVYDHQSDGMILSDEDYLSFMNLHGFAKGVYEYYYDTYHDVEGFPSYEDFEVYVLNFFGEDFFRALNSGRYLMNAYCSGTSIHVIGQRLPGLYYPLLYETELKTGDPDTFTTSISPSGTRSLYWVLDDSKLYFLQPYMEMSSISEEEQSLTFSSQAIGSYTFSEISSIISVLNNVNNRGFFFSLGVNTPSLIFNNNSLTTKFKIPNTYNGSTFSRNIGIFYPFSSFNVSQQPPSFNYNPVYTSFPVWENDNSVFSVGNRDWQTLTYNFRQSVSCYRNFTLSPYIVSEYENIPVPTATPTPVFTPTPTLRPSPMLSPIYPSIVTPTPLPVGSVEPFTGIGEMFTLFTIGYPFSIGDIHFTIRPFIIFVSCALLGLFFRIFMGGKHE